MELQLVPLDNETGEVLQLNPEMLKKYLKETPRIKDLPILK